jgi:hypothetical protein
VTTALCLLGRIVADRRWHSKLQNKAQETKFLTLSLREQAFCVKKLRRGRLIRGSDSRQFSFRSSATHSPDRQKSGRADAALLAFDLLKKRQST